MIDNSLNLVGLPILAGAANTGSSSSLPPNQNNVVVDKASTSSAASSAPPSAPSIPQPDPTLSGLTEDDIINFLSTLGVDLSGKNKTATGNIFDGLKTSSILLLVKYICSTQKQSVINSLVEINKADKDSARSINDEIAQKFYKAAEDQQAARKSGLLGQIFGWIATALAIVTACITCNPALITAAVIMLTLQIDNETGGHIAKVGGGALEWTLVALSIVLSLGACAGMAGASTAAKAAAEGVECVSKLAQFSKIAYIGKFLSYGKELGGIMPKVFAFLQISEGVADIGTGVSGAVKAKQDKDYASDQAESKRLQAELDRLLDVIDQNDDLVKRIIKKLEENGAVLADAINSTLTNDTQNIQFVGA